MKIGIIGGGASGLMLASILRSNNFTDYICIFEKEDHVGKKILLSGNGRCNLSNNNINENCYNNNFGYEISSSFDVQKYFNSLGLLTSVDEEGRIYPYSNTSNSVLDVIRESISDVNIITNTTINKIVKDSDGYMLYDSNNTDYRFDVVVIATGGKTYYKDSNSYKLASMMSHHISMLRPSLTYLKIKENLISIENIKLKVKASLFANDKLVYEDFGEVLFKKDYLSGIVMFQLSSIINRDPFKRYSVSLDLLPNLTNEELKEYLEKYKNNLTGLFPKMVNQYISKNSNGDLVKTIKDLRFNVVDNIDFKVAQVTSGGVNVNEINNNLESKMNKNLYFAGEILDVDGICGGYNLHFAFSCANKIAKDILEKYEK